MAIAEMSKLSLVAMSYDRDEILNALQTTCAAEITTHTLVENTHNLNLDYGELRDYLSSAEHALDYLSSSVASYRKDNKLKEPAEEDIVLTYSEFISQRGKKDEADGIIAYINSLESDKKRLEAELVSAKRLKLQIAPYSSLTKPFSHYKSTAKCEARLGLIGAAAYDSLAAQRDGDELFALSRLADTEWGTLIVAVFHKSFEGDRLLQTAGFVACPFKEGAGAEIYARAEADEARLAAAITENIKTTFEAQEKIKPLSIYCDYLSFETEKAQLSEMMLTTQSTILLEAYVPKDKQKEVEEAVCGVSGAVCYEFSEPAEGEIPPTLYKNNALVKNFETITDMYSPPSSKEMDPNAVMAFFYSLFLGFIMGDIGYGLMMIFGGGGIYLKTRKKPGGLTKLAGVFAVGGFFAVIWGILFNSFFGAELPFFKAVLPAPLGVYWSFMGISIPAVLIVSMLLGILHLGAGYVCCAAQAFRRGRVVDGIFDGLVWAIFSVGVGLAVAGLTDDFHIKKLALIGGIMAGAALVIAMLTAGRKEKFIGKFTKGFGAAYGVINYASDILSYARLYGLMLSGVVIAQIITGFVVTGYNGSTPFFSSGNVGLIILGVILLVVGHIFNFAIGLLGAYIHDARLQYVEFYGKFFEGEGRLFNPVGSTHRFVRLRK